jgi:hypothetical protein
MFTILSRIEQDGTYDQLKPLKALMDKGCQILYSYDLSAATDRLPIDLQEQLLGILINPEFASSWRSLLVDRPWYLDSTPLYYSVGQPMGALSS